MHLFDEGKKIVRNTKPESILTTFFTTFLGFSASLAPSTPETKIEEDPVPTSFSPSAPAFDYVTFWGHRQVIVQIEVRRMSKQPLS